MTKLNLPWCVLLSFLMSYFWLAVRGQILSRNKAVTMSSTFSGWDGNRAVDGNYDTRADDCQCCAATEKEINPWMEVDLGDTYTVTRILVYSRSDQFLDKQNITGLTIHTDDEQQFQPPSNQWYQYDTFFNFAFTSPVSTRTVSLTVLGERHLVICEVDIIYDKIISRNKNVSMDSTFQGWAGHRAVDGDLRTDATPCSCCAATGRRQSPWLRVDLEAQYIINYVVIYGRTDGTYCAQSFEGMSIEFDNQEVRTIPAANESKNTAKFYEFRSETTDSVSVVTLRLSHEVIDNCLTQLVVCELVIYGVCDDGTYGHNCNKTCGYCRDGNICNKQTGECTQCEYGYIETNLLCTDLCPSGTHGYNCTEVCGKCGDNKSCNQTNGQCEQCADGYTETNLLCTEVCPNGTYGHNCTEVCGQCRNNTSCNKTNGMCEQCEDGYTETSLLCTELCPNGTYGRNCTGVCGYCRNSSSCNQTNGMCEQCEDGYTETNLLCTELCANGTYGHNCTKICGQCRNGISCNQINGLCEQCEDGYKATNMLCTELCPNGTHGENCTERCGNCINGTSCNQTDGACSLCDDGYTSLDILCKTHEFVDCENGTYGQNCSEECGTCRHGAVCNKTNGLCDQCERGFLETDLLCKSESIKVETESNIGVIAGSVCGALVLAGVAIGVIIFVKRKGFRQKLKEVDYLNGVKSESGIYYNEEIVSDNHSDPEDTKADTVDEYVNVKNVPDIRLPNLWSYIYKQKENKAETLKSQYDEFEKGLLFPTNDAITYKNKVRYKDMAPYDHTRVHLEVEEENECEFINASHINGFDRDRKFIAAQGPMNVNVMDFWRMIWQYDVTKIVMLTNLVEMASVKCIQYWPDNGDVTYANIRIALVHEETQDDFVIRSFELFKLQSKPKQVRQFHYRTWPDKDVPRSAWSLVNFWREVMKGGEETSAPIVVHCSAGVGRTGTFIALDNLYNQAMQKGVINPVQIVSNLRNQRQKMVQTQDQYVYLHDAVAAALFVGTHHIPEEKYTQYYSYMVQKDTATKKLNLHKQYLLLNDGLKHFEPERQTDARVLNPEIDEYKPKSKSKFLPKQVSSVTNWDGKESFILSTSRKDRSLEDVWKLVDQMEVKSIVTLVEQGANDAMIISSKQSRIHTELVSEETDIKYTVRTYAYERHQSKASQNKEDVKQFVLWLDKVGIPDKSSTVKMIKELFKWQSKLSDSQPVLIQCSDDMARSGIMCVLLNEVDRMLSHGGQINVLETVNLMKKKMPGFTSSFEQYRFIHDVLHQLVIKKAEQDWVKTADETEIYVNVQS